MALLPKDGVENMECCQARVLVGTQKPQDLHLKKKKRRGYSIEIEASNLAAAYLVFDEQCALRGVREVGSGPLHHEFEGCVGWDVLQVVPPQNSARLAVNAKELKETRGGSLVVWDQCWRAMGRPINRPAD